MPGYLTTLVGFGVYSLIVNLIVGPRVGGWFFPTAEWWVLMLWVVPPFLALTLSVVLRLSARVKSSAAAQQASGRVTLPLIMVSYAQSSGIVLGSAMSAVVVWACWPGLVPPWVWPAAPRPSPAPACSAWTAASEGWDRRRPRNMLYEQLLNMGQLARGVPMTTDMKVGTRTVDGLELAAAGTWVVDPSHSSVDVVGRHMVISKVRGRFTRFSGQIEVGKIPEASSVEFTVDATSIDTAEQRRDDHLRAGDFLDTERHPEITFRSTRVEPGRRGHWQVTGDLTVRDVTRQVTLDVELEGVGAAYGGPRLVLSGTLEVDREEFGLTWNMALETSGVLVGRQLKIELSVQAALQ